MKTYIFSRSLGLALLAITLAASAQAASYSIYPFEKSPEANADATARLARQYLGTVELQTIQRTQDTLYLSSPKDNSTHIELNVVNGEFRFERGLKRYLGEFVPKLPSTKEVGDLSLGFLKQNGLLPKNTAELKLAHIGGLRAQSLIDGKNAGPIIDKLITVTYTRLVDGLPVIGPGSKLVLQIGDRGEVVGLIRHWRELNVANRKEISRADLIDENEAYDLAKRQILSEFGKDAVFEVCGKGPAYYDNSGGILQPVYIFETEVITIDDSVVPTKYLAVIPLLRNSPEPLALTALDPKAKELIRNVQSRTTPPRHVGDE